MKRDKSADSFRDGVLISQLTDREKDILRLMADGLSNREIAQSLSLSFETIKWYNKQIYDKLGVSNRTQAVSDTQSLGLLNESLVVGEESPSENIPPRPNLPAQVTSFVGRQREVTEARSILQKSRLLTLSGPGGSGKTRLALRLASELMPSFPDGVYYVPLAPVTEAENLLWAIAERVGFQFHLQNKPLDQLLKYFREKTLLLVLDNFEHLIAGTEILSEILSAAPQVRLLVTSRERLGLYGEVNYVVSGLALPDETASEVELRTESVELFVQRAQAFNPSLVFNSLDLPHLVRICRLVDGLPLGIELAATWVDVLKPEEIADEIEHSLDILDTNLKGTLYSQNSIRAAFDRSWNLLNDVQQTAFRRLSVFRSGFTRQTVEAIAGVGLRTLQALVSKSLLRYDPAIGRYEIHELLRHYAEEKLEISGEVPIISRAHACHFADFMDERWPQMKGHRQKSALLEIEADIENIRAAWQYWIMEKNVARLVQFLHGLWVVHDIRGWYPAGIELFERAVEVMQDVGTDEAQAAWGWLMAAQGLYNVAGGIYRIAGGTRKGFTQAQQGIQLVERLNGYDPMLIIPLISLFITASQVNEVDVALGAAQDCLDVATRIGDHWAIAKAKQFLSITAIEAADYGTAGRMASEALTTFEDSGDKWSESVLCIEVLGLLAISQREFDRAKEWIVRGLNAAHEIDFKYAQQMAYWQLGYIAALQENYAEAGENWARAVKMGETILGGGTIIGFGGTSNSVEWGGRVLIKD